MQFGFRKFLIFFILVSLVCFYFIIPVRSASVTNFSDTVSTHLTSTAANHTIQFTTPSGVGASETIILGFSNSFTIGSVDYTDIDVADDGVDLTLAAAAAGATWGAAFSGNVLTITSGTGTIAATSVISIQIGTNATNQTVGDAQITNPASTGSYTINLSGTFGDTGDTAVPVVTSEGAAVTATISAGGGPGGVDTTPPIISNIQVINITQTSARITWDTNEVATSIVKYGLSAGSYTFPDESSLLFTLSHGIDLTELTPGTTYHFQVGSLDPSGNAAYSTDQTFTTALIAGNYLYMRAIPEKRLPVEGNWSDPVHIQVFAHDSSETLVDEYVTTNNDGYNNSISLSGLAIPGTYDFLIKGDAHLQLRKDNVAITSSSDLVDFSNGFVIKLKAGDVNSTEGDNYVNGADLSVISTKLYASGGRVDLNKDTTVNGLEFAISITNLYDWGDF